MVRSSISGFKRRLVFVWVVPLLLLGMYQTYVFGGSALVEKTGQITSYSPGDDGDLKKGVAWPNPRFTDNGNGAVTDNLTGLIWLKNAKAFGSQTWEQALASANDLASGTAGLTDGSKAGDWCLPNVKELQSLLDRAYYGPALSNTSGTRQWTEGNPFIGVQSYYYWSSTTYSNYSTGAWSVYLFYGIVDVGNKTYTYYAWPVRAGQ